MLSSYTIILSLVRKFNLYCRIDFVVVNSNKIPESNESIAELKKKLTEWNVIDGTCEDLQQFCT